MTNTLSMPKYLPHVAEKFTRAWTSVLEELPYSQQCLDVSKNTVAYTANVKPFEDCLPGEIVTYEVHIFWQDQCRNGFNFLSMRLYANMKTAPSSVYLKKESLGVPTSDVIKAYFPQLEKYLRYARRLYSPYGPLYYFENTIYLAGEADFNGNLPGQQIKTRQGLLGWTDEKGLLTHWGDPTAEMCIPKVSQGKSRELNDAKSSCDWVEASDDTMSLPEDQLITVLAQRLPSMMQEFKQDILALGFTY